MAEEELTREVIDALETAATWVTGARSLKLAALSDKVRASIGEAPQHANDSAEPQMGNGTYADVPTPDTSANTGNFAEGTVPADGTVDSPPQL